MRYRMLATYRGVPYEAGMGPSGADVVLFAACPPPEELGFEPATGHWRKRVIRAEIDALWESRPVGTFRGEPCLVLDDLGDRLHIAYLGTDSAAAARLGYWQIDRGVFELLTPREDVTDLTEERVDKPLRVAPPAAPGQGPAYPYGGVPVPEPSLAPDSPLAPRSPLAQEPPLTPERPLAPESSVAPGRFPAPDPFPAPRQGYPPGSGLPSVPEHLVPPADPAPAAAPATGMENGGRSARKQRVTTRDVFSELADLAAIPRSAYALETEADGALCLLHTPAGYEVFVSADRARHEVRSFPDEEAAYFYLFGVLAAEAIRNGTLAPARNRGAAAL